MKQHVARSRNSSSNSSIASRHLLGVSAVHAQSASSKLCSNSCQKCSLNKGQRALHVTCHTSVGLQRATCCYRHWEMLLPWSAVLVLLCKVHTEQMQESRKCYLCCGSSSCKVTAEVRHYGRAMDKKHEQEQLGKRLHRLSMWHCLSPDEKLL